MTDTINDTDRLKEVQIELQYLPCLEYFACLLNFDRIWIDTEERYIKQTYRNRCNVLTTNKIDTLTVPVIKYQQGALTKDIKIDYGQDWVRRHWGCLQSAYGRSPFFEYYSTEFEAVYARKPAYLVDLNYDLLTICLRLVGVKKEIRYKMSGAEISPIAIKNEISAINNKKTGAGYKYYVPKPYYQTFGNDFVENLSIVDLIFNTGPESRLILLESLK
ncbi:hypothetical protein DYBT9275_00842 [Dyadobacter sp. CECT 9275]|uniref:WbqC-like protein family protein n=1 Tax=Dyadobacter helix TaxID=2822344 RepID=A0A916J9D7_9BACT|nr:WbqC family protein [Dyadobacter sp. CECT 9275]CAG4991852.1 hypothetical protein DYBT9275_00842 [Dyadobacter sp. CECT 9275]